MTEGLNWLPPKPTGNLGNINEIDKVIHTKAGELTLSAQENDGNGIDLEAGEYFLKVNRETGEAFIIDSQGLEVAKYDPVTRKTTKI
jgi:hypothetical protein